MFIVCQPNWWSFLSARFSYRHCPLGPLFVWWVSSLTLRWQSWLHNFGGGAPCCSYCSSVWSSPASSIEVRGGGSGDLCSHFQLLYTTTRSCHHVGCVHRCHSRRCPRPCRVYSYGVTSNEFRQFLRPSLVEVCFRLPLSFSQPDVSVFCNSGLEQRLSCW